MTDFFELDHIECAASGVSKGRSGYEINTSSILTKLIQEAGKWCESYASDLFIDWNCFIKNLDGCRFNNREQWLFGMRPCGVDSRFDIITKMTEPVYGYTDGYYRAVWGLNVYTTKNDIKLELGPIKASTIYDQVNQK